MSDSKSGDNSPTGEDLPEPKTKKSTSYTYWVKHNPDFYGDKGPVNIGPTKVDPEIAQKLKEQEESKTNGHSAWNQSGTWEEKNLKAKVFEDILKQSLTELGTDDGKIKFIGVDDVDGEGKLIISRGKKRLGYELSFKLNYKGEGDLEGGEGALNIKELVEDGEFQYDVESTGDHSAECKASIKSSLSTIVKKIQSKFDVMKQ